MGTHACILPARLVPAGPESCVPVRAAPLPLLLPLPLVQEAYLRRLSKMPVEEEDDGLL